MQKAMTIAYAVGRNLYLNITNRCPCACTFCIRTMCDGAYGSDPLWLEHEPSMEEIRAALDKEDLSQYEEVVFCGYGEPTERLDILCETAKLLKSRGVKTIRINTNGLSDLIHGRKTAADLKGLVDIVSVSLNAGTEAEYLKVTRPKYGAAAYPAMQQFALDCKQYVPQVMFSVVDILPQPELDAAQQLAEGSGTQAAAVEELVATATSVAEQVEESKKDALQSAEETQKVTAMMEQSQDKMQEMMEAVQKIHETSKQVVGIIATIEEIADQTNLLSLNASIEAARAGEAGKGFAVVADEIGKLAQESSKAANMTRELIGVSMEEINKGNQIADHVMDSLKTAVEAVDNVNGMIQKTAGNAADQAQSMEQIRVGIEEISQGVQDNSAIAEESSATSEELASQATLLNELVQHFELQP